MKTLRYIVIALLLIGTAIPVFADADSPDADVAETAGSRAQFNRIGMIFNTPSILLEIDRYKNAGVGLKTMWGQHALRTVFGLEIQGSDRFGGTFGTAYEYHPVPGRVSPYFGGSLVFSFEQEGLGDTVWTDFGVSIGPILGVEFTLVEGLAVFAEYTLSFDGVRNRYRDDHTWNYLVSTRLGNRRALGIVVYFRGSRRRAADGANKS